MRKKDLRCQSFFVVALLLFFVSSGCTVRTYSVVKERPDREVSGNKGYLTGESPERDGEVAETRTTYVLEIELGKDADQAVDEVADEVVDEVADEVIDEVIYEVAE
ncbi:hypothetical protein ACFL2Y_05345 [Candidatus Omnitrophota bacterium]